MRTACPAAWAAWATWTCKSVRVYRRKKGRLGALFIYNPPLFAGHGQVAQLVEQRTENPCVAGSIPALATKFRPFPNAKRSTVSNLSGICFPVVTRWRKPPKEGLHADRKPAAPGE